MEYLDMTFCPFYRSCKKGNNCYRALTPEVIEKAQQWFRGNKAPILQYTQKPPCYQEAQVDAKLCVPKVH
jgi:hypothetical protein